jgi:hypothetical protein
MNYRCEVCGKTFSYQPRPSGPQARRFCSRVCNDNRPTTLRVQKIKARNARGIK